MTRYAAKVLTARGAPCARGTGSDPSKVLAACGVTDLASQLPPDAPVSGRAAGEIVNQIGRLLAQ